MSRNITKSYLSRDEISLLVNSEEAKNTNLYGNLYDILLKIRKLKAVSLDELENLNLNYHGVSALVYNKHTLIDNATREWIATTDIVDNPEKNASCQLCNAPNLRYECHICNMHNKKELLVGSECVNKFKIDGYLDQKKQLVQIQKGHKIVQRRNEFYRYFPDYERIIFNAENYFNTLPILLPYELYTKLQETITRMRLIYIKFVNEGKKPFKSEMNSFELFQLALDQYNKLKEQSDQFILDNENKPLICRRREINWMISNNKLNLLQEISENEGIYTRYTLKQIYLADFVVERLNLFEERNISAQFKFEKINESGIIFSFNKSGYYPTILFSISLNSFMNSIGANCIIDSTYTYSDKEIIECSHTFNSKRNLESILNYTYNFINKLNCALFVDEETNSLILYRKGDRAIRQFDPNAFINAYKYYMILTDDKIKKYLLSIVKDNNTTKWITLDVQSKQGIDDKINRLYKEYRDEHLL